MFKILCIGDPHFKKDNEDETNIMEKEILSVIDNKEPNIVVVLGDVMHNHGETYIGLFNRANKFLHSISKKMGKKNTFVLIGNHDRINNKVSIGDDHFFNLFKDIKDGPTIVDDVMIVDREDHKFLFAPYMEPSTLMDYVSPVLSHNKIEIEDISTYFLHQEIKGCHIGNHLSEIGDEWLEEWPYVMSGHIHEWHMPQPNVCYAGTPMQVSFGCQGRKTISLLTYENSVSIPEQERIELSIPKKIQLKMSCADFPSFNYDGKSWVKLKITDTSRKITALKKTSKFINYKDESKIKFMFVDKGEEVKMEDIKDALLPSMINSTFKTRLMEKMKNEESHIKDIFDEIMME